MTLLRSRPGRIELRRRWAARLWPALAYVGRGYRRTLARRVTIVAVVGSVGKTTTTRVVSGALDLPVHRLALLNANSHDAMGRALLRIRPWQRRAVLEVGIEGPGQMRRQAATVRPQIVVVTAIAGDHWRSFQTLEATRDEKAHILRSLPANGIAIVNADDPNVRWMATQTKARVVLVGESEDAEIRATGIELDWPHGMRFAVHVDGETRAARIRLTGRHMVFSALAAIAVARAVGISLDDALASVAVVDPTPGRMQTMVLPNGAVVLRDDFKASTDTFASALDTFATVPAGRRIVVLGAIAEEGGKQDYRDTARRAGEFVDKAIFVGSEKNSSAYRAGSLAAGWRAIALRTCGPGRRLTTCCKQICARRTPS